MLLLVGFLFWHLGVVGNGLYPDARPWGIAGAGIALTALAWNVRLAGLYGLAFSILVLLIPAMPAASTAAGTTPGRTPSSWWS